MVNLFVWVVKAITKWVAQFRKLKTAIVSLFSKVSQMPSNPDKNDRDIYFERAERANNLMNELLFGKKLFEKKIKLAMGLYDSKISNVWTKEAFDRQHKVREYLEK